MSEEPTVDAGSAAGNIEGPADGARQGGLNLATVWEAVARVTPEAPALIHGETVISWASFERRSACLAQLLHEHGIAHNDHVALYLPNRPQYLEATFAAFKVRAATVNVNYRYLESELEYLFDDSDAKAIIFHSDFADRLGSIRDRLGKVELFVCVDATAEAPLPAWAIGYEEAIEEREPMPAIPRSGQDLWLLYTGGTTGRPKGVMWPHANLLQTAEATFGVIKAPVPRSLEEVEVVVRSFAERNKSVRVLPAAPLMHGTSAITAIGVLSSGGAVITLTSSSFDAHELWQAVESNRVTQLTIVGDAFSKPMLEALDDAEQKGTPYNLASLKVILSSGVMWSQESKTELHKWTTATLADSLGSSEGVGFASSVSRPGVAAATARFSLGKDAAVFRDDGTPVEPGSTDSGLLAVAGAIPVGYYNDPVKSAQTFRAIGGRVWSIPGDHASVDADGTIVLLGRGSACINTGGEKVYPEEVEETLKLHQLVRDANVVGVRDDRWGTAVHAVVSIEPSGTLDGGDRDPERSDRLDSILMAHCREHLAGYKCPKMIHVVPEVRRGPNGKPDYRWAGGVATGSVGADDD